MEKTYAVNSEHFLQDTITECIAKNEIQIPFHTSDYTGKLSPLTPNLPTKHKVSQMYYSYRYLTYAFVGRT